MPEVLYCSKCGYTLYASEELIPPEDIMKKYDDRCPRCWSILNFDPRKIIVKPIGRSSVKKS